ncbi:unnamed protein product [Scytosiphon promiscuus]
MISKVRGAEEDIFNLFQDSSPKEWEPLQRAAARGDEALALRLIKAGAEIGTAMHRVVEGRHAKIVAALVKSGVPVDRIHRRNCCFDSTPLHIAANLSEPTMVLQLRRLLDPASAGGNTMVMEMMRSLTAQGASPLYIAARGGYVGVVRLLLENGCPPNVANRDGSTALHGAAYHGRIDTIDLLVRSGADLEAVGRVGTPLDYAAEAANTASIVALLRHGAAVEGDPDVSKNPLWRIVHSGRPTAEALLPLLRRGADVNALEQDDESILHRLCCKASIIPNVAEIVDLFLRWGADETIYSYDGGCPLNWLLEHNLPEAPNVGCVRRLLENAPADRDWRRRGFLVMCRAFPERVRINPTPAPGIDAPSPTTLGPEADPASPELPSTRRPKLEIAPTSGGGGGSGSGAPAGSGSDGGSASGTDTDRSPGGWDSAVAAWMTRTGEPAIFRRIVLFL